jgi:hypothetical protein
MTIDNLTAEKLAEVLREPNLPLLRQVLSKIGHDRTTALLAETLQCEESGGLLTTDGTRRRTPGGTFFHLVRQQLTPEERRRVFPWTPAQRTGRPQQSPPSAPQQVPTWEDLLALIDTLVTTPAGEARTMKVTLIGRPGTVESRQTCVVFRMQGKAPGPLPKGLPPVPAQQPLAWTVMVALRQWNRVKESLTTHQDDQLIIEGYPLMQGTQHVLLAQSCISMLQQRAQKQIQQQAPQEHG